ncbi:MAG: hypothetical protein NBV57_05055 [Algoriphagus sp.]|nr:hypothetical protein [Algoriphagus sp.]
MKELSIEQMEIVSGGSLPGCVGAVIGTGLLIGLVISTPATGGLSLAAVGWLSTQAVFGGIATGLSWGDCISM